MDEKDKKMEEHASASPFAAPAPRALISSTEVIRPSGVILETDLVNYLPELTDATQLPPRLTPGKIWVGPEKAWIILGNGTPVVFVDMMPREEPG